MTSYSGSTDKMAMNGQLSLCNQTASQRHGTKIKITLIMMTDDDTGNFHVDGPARIAVLLPVWKQRRCTLECVP